MAVIRPVSGRNTPSGKIRFAHQLVLVCVDRHQISDGGQHWLLFIIAKPGLVFSGSNALLCCERGHALEINNYAGLDFLIPPR